MTLEFTDTTVRYRRHNDPALDGINLSVDVGRTVLLGPNGAGKSTLLSVAASVLQPTSGTVAVDGLSPHGSRDRRTYRSLIGWMPQRIESAPGLSVRQQVALSGWLMGMDRPSAWEASAERLARFGLADMLDRRSNQLSGGQRARMGLAQAVVHNPQVLLLDEPTASLDPDQKDVFVQVLRELGEDRTILVSTHDVGELSTSYDRVIVINHGKLLHHSDVSSFLELGGESANPVEAYRAVMVAP